MINVGKTLIHNDLVKHNILQEYTRILLKLTKN